MTNDVNSPNFTKISLHNTLLSNSIPIFKKKLLTITVYYINEIESIKCIVIVLYFQAFYIIYIGSGILFAVLDIVNFKLITISTRTLTSYGNKKIRLQIRNNDPTFISSIIIFDKCEIK